MKKIFYILFICFNISTYSQNIYLGLFGVYNIQTESLGYGLSLKKDFNKLSLVANASYYPKNNYNKINESIFGLDINYIFYKYKKINSYAIAGFAYNAWINHNESYMLDTQFNNWNADLGFGIKYNTCISPFIEIRYNVRWQECIIKTGLYYNFKCKRHKINIKKLPRYMPE